jgi:hypothetical protein
MISMSIPWRGEIDAASPIRLPDETTSRELVLPLTEPAISRWPVEFRDCWTSGAIKTIRNRRGSTFGSKLNQSPVNRYSQQHYFRRIKTRILHWQHGMTLNSQNHFIDHIRICPSGMSEIPSSLQSTLRIDYCSIVFSADFYPKMGKCSTLKIGGMNS